ncbi:FAD-dependent oxidoreductase [Rhodococcus opacus]|nr:FAD-dependent oxidoreductase [Rhodococcus opacus]
MLVVGTGPAGLTTAITLARQGIEVLVVERRPALSGLPRAARSAPRTMELLRSWGLEQEIRAGGSRSSGSNGWAPRSPRRVTRT